MERLRFCGRVAGVLAACGVLLGLGLMLTDQALAQKKEPDVAKKGDLLKKAPRFNYAEKRYTLEFREKPWKAVFEWLTDKTEVPLVTKLQPPTGSFTMVVPKGAKYSMAEIIDIINEGLLQHNYLLLRRPGAFTLVAADEKIDSHLVPLVQIDEFDERGDTEVVKVAVPLERLNAEEQAGEAKKLLGTFGEVVPLVGQNVLVLQDTIKNLRTAIKVITDGDKGNVNESFTYACKYIRAREAEERLTKLLGATNPTADQPQQPRFGGGGGGFGFPPQFMPQMPQAQPAGGKRSKTVVVTSDDNSNTVMVKGPPDAIGQAKAFLKKMDVPEARGDKKPVVTGSRAWNNYEVVEGNAEAMAKILTEQFSKKDPSARISAANANRIMAYAYPEDQEEIANFLKVPTTAMKTQTFGVGSLDADKVAGWLKNMFLEGHGGVPFIDSNPVNNTVIAKGSIPQLKEIKDAIEALGGDPLLETGTTRIINLGEGSAATLADALKTLMEGMRGNKVNVYNPSQLQPKGIELPPMEKKEAPALPKKKLELKLPKIDTSALPEATLPGGQVFTQLVDPQQKKAKEEPAGKPGAPVNITAFGNKLIVTSEDPEALKLVSELVRLLTREQSVPGDFAVIRLKYASAVDTATLLNDLFNPPKQQPGTQGGGGFRGGFPGGFGGGGPGGGGGRGNGGGGGPGGFLAQLLASSQQQPAQKERVRVVADPATNSLLVKANPLDMLTIRGLIKSAIDIDYVDNEVKPKTFVIGPLKYANAADVRQILADVYKDRMSGSSNSFQAVSSFGGGRFSQVSDTSRSGRPTVPLTVGLDNHTNSLIISCPEPLHKDIVTLVEQIEKASEDSKQVIKFVNVKGVDPYLVQQALAAIQGTRSTNPFGTGSFSGGMPGLTPTGSFGGGAPAGGFGGGMGGMGGMGGGRGGFGGGFGGGGPGGGGFGGGGPGGGGFGFGGGGGRGGFGGGGGGFGGGGGGRGGPRGPAQRGPDFFEQRVKDDPSQPILFDPQAERDVRVSAARIEALLTWIAFRGPTVQPAEAADDLIPVQYVAAGQPAMPALVAQARPAQVQAQPGQEAPGEKKEKKEENKAGQPGPKLELKSTEFPAPRLGVFVEPLGASDMLAIRANSPQDMEAALAIIQYVLENAKGANIDVRTVQLRWEDCNRIVNKLHELYNRVNIVPGANNLLPPRQQATQAIQTATGALTITPPAPQPLSLMLLPIPTQNSIIVAAPAARIMDVIEQIEKLDVPHAAQVELRAFPLKRAAALQVSQQLQSFLPTRFPGDQNMIRVTYDPASNTVYVQASPADMDDIRGLIERIENTVSPAVNDMRLFFLQNSLSDEVAAIIARAIADGTLLGTGTAGTFPVATPGAAGPAGALPGLGAGPGAGPIGAALGAAGTATAGKTKNTTLRFFGSKNPMDPKQPGGPIVEAGVLEDVHLNSYPRLNTILVSAPPQTMNLIAELIKSLDIPPLFRAEINVFTLKKQDAMLVAQMLQQIFLGGGTTTGGTGGARPGGALGGAPTGLPGGGVGGTTTLPPQIVLPGIELLPPGIAIIPLSVSVDERTNSIIAVGSRNDMLTIESIIAKLEDTPIQDRHHVVYKMRNAQAVDVANVLNDFVTKTISVYTTAGLMTPWLTVQRTILISADPISNSLIISATPQWQDDLMNIIYQLDVMPPQVMIHVLVAEVVLNREEEMGVELGLQSPVLFQRGILPQYMVPGTISYASAPTTGTTANPPTGQFLPPAATVTSTANNIAIPGFDWLNPTYALGNNPNVAPATIGVQGLTNLGVGRVSPTQSVGGFVFSMSSDFFSVLMRALAVQGRVETLSRPQVMTLDNQTAFINIGEDYPIVTGVTVTGTGLATQSITRVEVGVQITVTPKIQPDGRVLMRIIPEISSVNPTPVALGSGNISTALNIQRIETTVVANDGETIVLGGMLQKQDTKTETRVPWLGDLPGIGALFRYRTQNTIKTELLVIMTPHVVRSAADAEFIWGAEARKMDWTVPDVVKIQGVAPPQGPLPPPPASRHFFKVNVQPEGQPGIYPKPLFPNTVPSAPVPPDVYPPHGPVPPPGIAPLPGVVPPAPLVPQPVPPATGPTPPVPSGPMPPAAAAPATATQAAAPAASVAPVASPITSAVMSAPLPSALPGPAPATPMPVGPAALGPQTPRPGQ